MIRFLIIVFLCTSIVAQAQEAAPASAKDYFNNGSATFIQDNPEPALAIVNEGLSFYPDNEPLLKLKQLLEQQDEQNEDQQQEQDQDQDEQEQDEQENEEDQDQENEDQEDQNNEEDSSQDEQQQEQPAPEDMTEEEANMVLDSLRQLEQAQREELTQQMIRQQMQNMPPVEKDW